MTESQYIWKHGKPEPVIHEHSLAKHRVLEAYINRYIKILTSNPQMEGFRLHVVDGFSGGGVYQHYRTREITYGSPIRLLSGALAAIYEVNRIRHKPIKYEMNYYFVEKRQNALSMLQSTLPNIVSPIPEYVDIKYIRGSFESKCRNICDDILGSRGRTHRAIFVLDQYGYTNVPTSVINKIFDRLAHAEVILTFNVDYLIDYIHEDPTLIRGISNKTGISAEDIRSVLHYRSENVNRAMIQKYILDKLCHEFKAEFFTPFFIKSRQSHKSYWLLHLSRHPRARDAMTELHWQFQNHFVHQGKPGLNMLGFDPLYENTLPFGFDEQAGALTHEALVNELPHILSFEGISFGDLFRKICNETPASAKRLEEAIVALRDYGDIDIFTSDGRRRDRTRTLDREDIICL